MRQTDKKKDLDRRLNRINWSQYFCSKMEKMG